MQLLRIAQESVNNAVAHGQASLVRITLPFENNRVSAHRIPTTAAGSCRTDHDPAPQVASTSDCSPCGAGRALRGRMAIISSPGHGTTIETSVPLLAE